jgi:membrane dipeptidase
MTRHEDLPNEVADLHANSIIVNGLAQPGNLGMAYAAMADGGITATNLTVAANEGFEEGMLRVEEALRTLDDHPRRSELDLVLSSTDIHEAKRNGRAGVLVGFQNADPIEDKLDYLHLFHRLGLRVLQLTYQRRNLLGDGCGESDNAGLSLFGREVVAECNELGILVDLSHVGQKSTLDAIAASEKPVVFSHANSKTINPVIRNKSDDQIRALAEAGGVMGITSISRLISAQGRERASELSEFIEQIEYVAELVGIDHVGVGLDIQEGMTEESFMERRKTFLTQFPELKFGGDFPFETYFVKGLATAANFRSITLGLSERGYSDEDMQKVLGGNFMRVLDAVL